MTEEEVRVSGADYKVSKFPFSASGRAQIKGETSGLVKMICDLDSGKVLGVHILGPQASDLIAEAALVIQLGGTAQDVAHTIHAHPTLSEALREAALGQLEGSLHFREMEFSSD
jgi:dihydrolipoamide dehydrogenase